MSPSGRFLENFSKRTEVAEKNTQTVMDMSNKFVQTCSAVEWKRYKDLEEKCNVYYERLSHASMCFENFILDTDKFKFYTGLFPEQFNVLWIFLAMTQILLKFGAAKKI